MSLADRLFKHLAVDGWCWIWTGCHSGGYGHIKVAGSTMRVHRVMADLITLPGEGPEVCHTCNNKACFNPAHLYRGYHVDNMRDASIDGLLARPSCPGGHQYIGTNLYISPGGMRGCRICRLEADRRRDARERVRQ
jgi:hypothetical protein